MKKIFQVIIFILFISSVFAQNDTNKTGTTVIFLGSDRKEVATEYSRSAIKLGITDFISGMYGLHYERELSSIFSIQGGLGLTGRNYTQNLFHMDDQEMSNNSISGGIDVYDDYYDMETRTSKLGYFIALKPKFFFNEDGFDGSFISFMYVFRRYNYDAQNVSTEYPDVVYLENDFISEFETNSIFGFGYGWQMANEKTITEWEFTLGINSINAERRDVWQVPDNNSSYVTEAYIDKVKKSNFHFGISFKLGLFWDPDRKK